MIPAKRPKPTETEEDLLKEEEEFLKNLKAQKVVPAAQVVKVAKSNTAFTNTSVKGDTSTSTSAGAGVKVDSNNEKGVRMEVDEGEGGNSEEEDDGGGEGGSGIAPMEHPVEAVLFQVKERAFDASKLQGFTGLKAPPEVVKVQLMQGGSGQGQGFTKKKSLFARSFDARQESRRKARSQQQSSGQPEVPVSASVKERLPSEGGAGNRPAPADIPIGDKIHPYLAGMTEDDILLEQKRLLEKLDPKLVEFIRKRGQASTSSGTNTNTDVAKEQPQPMEVSETAPEISEGDLPIDPKSVQKYPGMSKVELGKLAWAGVIQDPQPLENLPVKREGKSARFDFSGVLLPDETAKDTSTYEKALHHHGEEMERPGYSIDELLTLARSVNIQQRSIALETLGNVYARAHTGIYDKVLEQSLFQLLDFMEFIHVVRKGMDNNDSNSINASLGCLAALLYVEHEEACLDATYLWPNARPFPLLTTKPEEMKKDYDPTGSEMKDYEFLQLDLIDFLVNRTEILARVEYLLMTKSDLFNEKGVTSLLKILIRVARHSPSMLIQHERLLKYIAENHISPNWLTLQERQKTLKGVPLIHALKLMRILVDSSASNAMKLYQNYRILPSVMSYLAYDQWKEQSHVEDVEDLILESFKIWLSFLSLGIAIDEYIAFFPVIMQFLQFYGVSDALNSFDLLHSAHLFALLTQIVCFGEQSKPAAEKAHSHWELVKGASSLIEQHCYKILKILGAQHLQETYGFDLALLSLGKGLEFLTHSLKYSDNAALLSRFQPTIADFTRCSVYTNLTSKLISHSVLLEDSPDKSRYSSNFATISAIRWEGELNPVMRSNSPFHFLSYFVSFCDRLCGDLSFGIVVDDNVEKYLLKVRHYIPSNVKDLTDYFIRFELSCLCELLKVLPKEHSCRFPVAYRCLAKVPSCSTGLFQNLLKVSLETCCKPKDLDAVYNFYLAYFSLAPESLENPEEVSEKPTKVRFDDGGHPGDGRTDEAKILFEKWTDSRTEEHWMFHPLENLYKRATGSPSYVKYNLPILELETRGCLAFIQQCLRHYCESIVQNSQDLVTVYCRVCRVFMLGSPNIYIDEITAPILQDILQVILNNGKVLSSSPSKPVFSKLKPTNSAAVSFYDFFTELVNEYFDNSYFNETFAAYILLPLRSGEDERVKNCFWSHEYLHCIRLAQDKIPISLEYLTASPEKDTKMLSVYTGLIKRNVLIKDRNPFLYEVAATHLRNSVDFMTEELRTDFNLLKL